MFCKELRPRLFGTFYKKFRFLALSAVLLFCRTNMMSLNLQFVLSFLIPAFCQNALVPLSSLLLGTPFYKLVSDSLLFPQLFFFSFCPFFLQFFLIWKFAGVSFIPNYFPPCNVFTCFLRDAGFPFLPPLLTPGCFLTPPGPSSLWFVPIPWKQYRLSIFFCILPPSLS